MEDSHEDTAKYASDLLTANGVPPSVGTLGDRIRQLVDERQAARAELKAVLTVGGKLLESAYAGTTIKAHITEHVRAAVRAEIKRMFRLDEDATLDDVGDGSPDFPS